jgi:hypothetical protein
MPRAARVVPSSATSPRSGHSSERQNPAQRPSRYASSSPSARNDGRERMKDRIESGVFTAK